MGSTGLTGTNQESTLAARCISARIADGANECRSPVLFSSLFFGMKGLYFNSLILIPLHSRARVQKLTLQRTVLPRSNPYLSGIASDARR